MWHLFMKIITLCNFTNKVSKFKSSQNTGECKVVSRPCHSETLTSHTKVLTENHWINSFDKPRTSNFRKKTFRVYLNKRESNLKTNFKPKEL